jgi:hypothetical protein
MSEPNGNGPLSLADLAKNVKSTNIRTGAARVGGNHPFLAQVRESWQKDRDRRDSGWNVVDIPTTMLDEMITSMRALSTWFGEVGEPIGVHMRIEYMPDPSKDPNDENNWEEVGPSRFDDVPRNDPDQYVGFKFTGRDRMKRGRRRQPSPQQAAAGQADEPTEITEDDELQPV